MDMPSYNQMIGLGIVGGILITVGIFIFKKWITNAPVILNQEPFFGAVLIVLGFGAIYYARYGNY